MVDYGKLGSSSITTKSQRDQIWRPCGHSIDPRLYIHLLRKMVFKWDRTSRAPHSSGTTIHFYLEIADSDLETDDLEEILDTEN